MNTTLEDKILFWGAVVIVVVSMVCALTGCSTVSGAKELIWPNW